MNTPKALRFKAALKVLLWAVLVAYLVLPVFLYGFTPMGEAALRMIHRTSVGQKAARVLEPTEKAKVIAEAEPEPTPAKEQPLTILLLGYGGPGHDGAYLTDSMVLAIVDPKSKSLTFLSVPRDTLVKLPVNQEGGVWSKINTAYAYGIDNSIYPRRPDRYKGLHGAGNMAKDMVANVTGLPVRYYLALDFNAFRKFIDQVGGVDLDVQSAFSSMYPNEDDPTEESEWVVVHFDAGKQRMNGDRALKYARSREVIDNPAEASDFARSRRQRQIMQSFRDKIVSPGGLLQIPALLSIAKQRVTTDIEVPGLEEIQRLLTDWRDIKFTEASLTSDNYLTSDGSSEKGYYLSPVMGQDNWGQIHTFVRLLVDDPQLGEQLARTKVLIRNGTGQPEKGLELRKKLQALGFVVAPVETVAAQPATRIEDMTEGDADHLITSLKSALGNPDIPVQRAGFPSLRVAIVLGEDWQPQKR